MPIAVDASTPARATGSSAYGTTAVTTASFSPPAGLLVVAVGSNSRGGAAGTGVSGAITNNGAALTWTMVAERSRSDASSDNGYAGLFVAVLDASRVGMTLTLTLTASDGIANNVGAPTIKPYVLTGAATTNVIGGSAEGSSVDNNLTTTAFTIGAAESFGFVAATDWNALGVPTSTDSTLDTFTVGVAISGASGYKTLGAAGGTATFNVDAPGTGAARWNWVSAEVKVASVAPASSPGAFFPFFP